MAKYFFTDGKQSYGPFSKDDLINQNISRKTKIWFYGLDQWTELEKIEELNSITKSIPPELGANKHFVHSKSVDHQLEKIKPPTKQNRQSIEWKILYALIIVAIISIFLLSRGLSNSKLYEQIVLNSYNTDEDFNIYLEKFYRDLEQYGIYPQKPKNTIIKFSKLDQLKDATHLHGICFGSNNDEIIEIYINSSSWDKFNKPMRYFIMYHELAHDILNLKDLTVDTQNEGKLMYPFISSYTDKNMDDFIESSHELFESLELQKNY